MSNVQERTSPLRWFGENPALLLTALYLLASAIGMLFAWVYFREFGINIFHYTEVGDFLLASFREPITWVTVIAAVALIAFDNAMSRRVEARSKRAWLRWYGSPRYRRINFIALVVLVVVYIWLFASLAARDVYEGFGNRVTVKLADDTTTNDAVLLGTTIQFLFLFDPDQRSLAIHPHENVQTITFRAPASKPTLD
ncbi:MAG: hypothetical protein V3U59_08935 [Gammaproteobacteria bacterium]